MELESSGQRTPSASAAGDAHADTYALTVMTYNLHHGEDPQGNYALEALAALIRAWQPDLVAAQEVDRRWGPRSRSEDQPARLAALTGLHACYGPNLDRAGAQYGNLILSRFPIQEWRNHHLPRGDAAMEQRGLLEALVDLNGTPVRFCSTHLHSGRSTAGAQEERARQVRAIMKHLDATATTAPTARWTILAGDFNARPGASELRPLLDHFADTWAAAGQGPGNTIPSGSPTARIDYVFVPPETMVVSALVPPATASDHRPVVVRLRLP